MGKDTIYGEHVISGSQVYDQDLQQGMYDVWRQNVFRIRLFCCVRGRTVCLLMRWFSSAGQKRFRKKGTSERVPPPTLPCLFCAYTNVSRGKNESEGTRLEEGSDLFFLSAPSRRRLLHLASAAAKVHLTPVVGNVREDALPDGFASAAISVLNKASPLRTSLIVRDRLVDVAKTTRGRWGGDGGLLETG